MQIVLGIGIILTIAGLAGLVVVIMKAARAKRSGLEGDAMQEHLRSLIPLNLGSLMLSALGLVCVIVAILLG